MKQLLLLAGAVGLSVAAPASAQDTSPSSLPGSPSVLWSWKVQPEVGSRYVMRTFSRSEMQMGGLPPAPARAGAPKSPTSVSIISRSSSVADYEVLSRDAQNATTVKLTYRSFDSSSSAITPGVSAPPIPAQDASGKMQNFMVGVSLTMKIAPDGKVWSVQGLDKLRARLMRSFAAMPGGGAVMQSLGGFFNEDAYKKSLSQSTGELPPFAIAAGDSWPYQISLPLPMGMDASTQGTRTLLSRRDGIATIKESGTFNLTQNPTAPAPAPAPASAAPVMPRTTMRMRGSTNGSTRVDEASGLPLEANAMATMSGRISMEAPTASAATPASQAKPGAPSNPRAMSMTMTARITTRTVMEPVAPAGA